jgi:hypothetical protein
VPRARELLAIVVLAAATATQLPLPGWNAGAHYALVQSLADGTPIIDGHLNQSGDIAWVDGHFYAAKSPGLAALSVPAYIVFEATGALPPTADAAGQGPPGARRVSEHAIWQVNLVVVFAFLVLLLLVRATVDSRYRGTGAAVALMLGLGTMLLPFATSYFSHVGSATLAFAAFALLLRERRRRSDAALVVAGVLAGLAVFVEAPAVIIALGLVGYAVADAPRLRRGLTYGAGLIVGSLPLALYNAWAFGSPLQSGYANAVKELGDSGHDVIGANSQGFFGLTYPDPSAALDLLISGRGLFVLTPVTLVALLGLAILPRAGYRREALLVGGLALAFLTYNAAYYLPFGGYTPGPRFLVPLLPFLGLPLAAVYRRYPRVVLVSAVVSAFWMVSATIAGPLLAPGASPVTWLRTVAHGAEVTGSIFGKGTTGALVFLVPALGSVALLAWPRFRSRPETARAARLEASADRDRL